MLSGIGDPDALAAHDIAVRAPLRGVGRNLRDHFSVGIEYERAQPGPFVRMMRLDRISLELANAYFFGAGFATDLPSGWTGFVKSEPAKPQPDIQFLFRAAPMVAGPYLPPFKPAVHGRLCVSRRPGAPGKRRSSAPGVVRSARRHPHSAVSAHRRSRHARVAQRHAPGLRARPAEIGRAVRREGVLARDPPDRRPGPRRFHPRHRPDRPPSARNVQDGRRSTTATRWSTASCACAGSRACAWSMRPSSRMRSAATSTPPSS